MHFLLLALLIGFSSINIAETLPANLFFRNPEVLSLKLGPNARYLMGHMNKTKNYLALVDTEENEEHPILLFDADQLILNDYHWIDESTVYFKYFNKSIKESKHGFIYFDFSSLNPDFNILYIKERGALVDPLVKQKNKLLFSKKTGNYYQVHIASTQQLAHGKLSKATLFKKPLKNVINYSWDAARSALIATTLEDDLIITWYLPEGEKKWSKLYSSTNLSEIFRPVGYFEEGVLAVLSNAVSDKISLYKYDIKDNEFLDILYQHPRYDLTDALFDKDNNLSSVSFFDHGRLVTEYFQSAHKDVQNKFNKALPGKQIAVIDRVPERNKSLAYVFASNDPGSYYLFDTKNLEAKHLYQLHPEFDGKDLAPSFSLASRSSDNKIIESIITTPKHSNGVLLVHPHGGPIGVREYQSYNPEVQFLANRGYTILQVNFRGSIGFGKTFNKEAVGQWGGLIEDDIMSAVAEVKQEYSFQKTCTIGTSYGGYSSMMLAIKRPEEYDCVISMYGVYDLPLLFNTSNLKMQERYLESVSRTVGGMNESLARNSPFRLADRISVPTLIVAGKEDDISGFEQANRMRYLMQKLKSDIEFIAYNSVGHGHSTWNGEYHQYAYIDDFLRRKLSIKDKDKKTADILANDLLFLSNSYRQGTWTSPDSNKALAYLKKSAQLGHNESQYKLGDHYLNTKLDPERANYWFRKAARQGNEKATYALAKLYDEGVVSGKTKEEVYELFEKAESSGSHLAYLDMAKYQCLGEGVKKNLDACIEKIFSKKDWSNKSLPKKRLDFLEKEIWNKQQQIMAEVMDRVSFSKDQIERIGQYYKSIGFDQLYPEVASIEFGEFYEGEPPYPIKKTTNRIPIRKNMRFGVNYILRSSLKEDQDAYAVARIKWTTPDLSTPSGKITNSIQIMFFPKLNQKSGYYYVLEHDYEMVEGEWIAEAFNIDGKQLFKKTFQTYYPEP
ncbi:prolyl oligopeptidase family serine peptidase [Microbulbifer sp. SSSA005]|uniref:prolyl oligopeptidase family serine peptidase n=1 Tax=Microbulbifer sp. SSSA005 TaxID=3243378 RepID=UPI0040393CAA